MADDITARSALAQAFERKVEASRWALVFEQLWPRLWIILGIVALFMLVSLAGVWPALGDTLHRVVLFLFAIALLAALVFAVRVRIPQRAEAIRRIERVSNQPHRPASSWEDTLSSGGDAATQALWKAHRKRMSDMLARLRVGKPSPRTDRYDPFALRALLFLGVVLLLGLVGDNAADRLRSAFRFSAETALANARLDAWITPPAYTSRPPVLLADGARGTDAQQASADPKTIDVPEKSTLIVRLSGAPGAQLALERLVSTGKPERYVNERPKSAADVSELRFVLTRTGEYRLFADGSEVGTWPINVIPDSPPKIALSKDPERNPRGSMKLTYKASDDYGLVSAAAKFKRIEQKQGDPSKAWARLAPLKGPRLPLERPPQLSLRLPTAKSKDGEAMSYLELGPHAWAGLPVTMTLEAHDAAGQTGYNPTLEMLLPERQFRKPLARAVIEQRRKLLTDNRNRENVLLALDALTIEPDGFIEDSTAYLGLRMAYSRLQRAKRRADYAAVNDQLWHAALRIEDGSLSDAERALRDAQDKLSQALEKGASDEELKKLMQELRQALNEYMEQLAKQSGDDQNKDYAQGNDDQNQTVNQQDLDRMMRNIEEMARNGSREQAQQLLSEMRDLMERLQAGRMDPEQQKNAQVMMRKLEELGDVANQQQQLMDETFGEQRKQQQGQKAQPGRGGRSQQKGAQQQGQRGQPSQKGERGQGQRGEQGQQQGGEGQEGQDGMQGQSGSGQGQLSQRQRQLRDRLSQLQRELQDKGMGSSEQLDAAGEAMEQAEQALQEGNLDEATGQQSRALENMRQGAQQMAQDMMKQMPGRQGQAGDAPRDPMGRPQRAQGPDLGTSVKVPDEIDMQRARQILEELRRRVGEQTRPPVELDYLERLLRRF